MSTLSEETMTRFLAGECTTEELRAIRAWLDESEEHAAQLFGLEELYQLGKLGSPADDVKKVWKAEKRLFRRLEREEAPEEPERQRARTKRKQP